MIYFKSSIYVLIYFFYIFFLFNFYIFYMPVCSEHVILILSEGINKILSSYLILMLNNTFEY